MLPRPVPRVASTLLACLALGLGACGGDENKKSSTQDASTEAAQPAPPPRDAGCKKASEPKPRDAQKLARPKAKLDPGKTHSAVVETNCGRFTIELDVKRAPKTTSSFAYLAKKGYYDNVAFDRVVPGFVIQGGDAVGNGGDPGYKIVEAPPGSLTYTKGVVAMAKTEIDDPGTSGSVFYVVTAEDAGLPPEYALVGKVTQGLDVVDRIGAAQTDPSTEKPLEPLVMRSVKIQSR